MSEPACARCRFFHRRDDEGGLCRRHAPSPYVVTLSLFGTAADAGWPPVSDSDWCGEYRVDPATLPEPPAPPADTNVRRHG